MQLWIDNTQLDASDSLEAAFEIARKHAEDAGRLIIDIQADGQPIADALLEEPPSDSAGINELRLTTTDFNAFLIETISTAKEALEGTRQEQNEAADQIRTGEFEPAVESLKSVLEGWHAVRDVVGQSAALAGFEIDELRVTDAKGTEHTGNECVAQLPVALGEIRNCLGKQDWSSLGDALEYDLDEQATLWDGLLDAMIARIQATPA
tara:strand:+ start:303 stop:926 length:624 start_codon:yes stop_codon:yes gene_type:complete